MMMFVHYVNQINELKASCRCFVKSIDAFWNFMAVVRKIFVPLKTVIDKLDEDCLLLQQMRQIIAENSNESMESDDNVDDLETGGFSLKERFDILRCCAVLVNENFYLYSTYQRHYLHIPVQLCGPVIFVLDALIESNLLQRLVTCLSKSKLSINPEIVASMMLIMLTIRPYSLDSTLRRYLWPIRDLISNYVCELADNNDGEVLRDHSVRQLSEHVWTLNRDYISANNALDSAGLSLSLKHLHSHFLAARLTGLHHLCVIINCSDENDAEETSSALAEYILHRKIVQLVFGPNLHVELIKQSHILLNFACLQCILTKSDLDSIWAAALMKHCNRQVLDLLNCTIKCMEYELVDHLYGLLKTLKPSEHNDLTLLLTFTVIKYIWNYKTYDSRRALLKPLVENSAESRFLSVNDIQDIPA
uniref:Uncharacterized protein n=1 Tax=Romanomermis culicivorax TaxID=13658 RepID=A0A915KT45_ROMCU